MIVAAAVTAWSCVALSPSVTAAAASPGSLDPSFGTGGKATTPFSGAAFANGVTVEPGGNIVAAGYSGAGQFMAFALANYNRDGSLDPRFGSGGTMTSHFAAGPGGAGAVAVQFDHKVLAAGSVSTASSPSDFALSRYNGDGILDHRFGNSGEVTTHFSSGPAQANAMAVEPDGKIVLAGSLLVHLAPDGFALARYDRAGKLDPSFGSAGTTTTSFDGGSVSGQSVAVQRDGRIVVLGTFRPLSRVNGFALARYLPDGSLDKAFGHGGRVVTTFPGGASALGSGLALASNGAIVASGQVTPVQGNTAFALARYHRDGSLDRNFGDNGLTSATFTVGPAFGQAVAIQRCGRIVLAGLAFDFSINLQVFALASFRPNGSLDTRFGSGGTVTTPFDSSEAHGNSLALQPDGKIVMAGGLTESGSTAFGLARYFGGCGGSLLGRHG